MLLVVICVLNVICPEEEITRETCVTSVFYENVNVMLARNSKNSLSDYWLVVHCFHLCNVKRLNFQSSTSPSTF
jgi:hypothetical protein